MKKFLFVVGALALAAIMGAGHHDGTSTAPTTAELNAASPSIASAKTADSSQATNTVGALCDLDSQCRDIMAHHDEHELQRATMTLMVYQSHCGPLSDKSKLFLNLIDRPPNKDTIKDDFLIGDWFDQIGKEKFCQLTHDFANLQ
jgi:hypothetical protein